MLREKPKSTGSLGHTSPNPPPSAHETQPQGAKAGWVMRQVQDINLRTATAKSFFHENIHSLRTANVYDIGEKTERSVNKVAGTFKEIVDNFMDACIIITVLVVGFGAIYVFSDLLKFALGTGTVLWLCLVLVLIAFLGAILKSK